MKYLYTLIISQYHYSYHQIVIRNLSETPESFLDKARLMVVEIGSYKAGKEYTVKFHHLVTQRFKYTTDDTILS